LVDRARRSNKALTCAASSQGRFLNKSVALSLKAAP
jgi:hypothetical protein